LLTEADSPRKKKSIDRTSERSSATASHYLEYHKHRPSYISQTNRYVSAGFTLIACACVAERWRRNRCHLHYLQYKNSSQPMNRCSPEVTRTSEAVLCNHHRTSRRLPPTFTIRQFSVGKSGKTEHIQITLEVLIRPIVKIWPLVKKNTGVWSRNENYDK
jgi:hypothetical protein